MAKSFKKNLDKVLDNTNPVMNFISEGNVAESNNEHKYILNTSRRETRSKRLQLLITPSLYERVKKASELSSVSVNEYINLVLDDITKELK